MSPERSVDEAEQPSLGIALLFALAGWIPFFLFSLTSPYPAASFLYSPVLWKNLTLVASVTAMAATMIAAVASWRQGRLSLSKWSVRRGGTSGRLDLLTVGLANLLVLAVPERVQARLGRLDLVPEVGFFLLVLGCAVAARLSVSLAARLSWLNAGRRMATVATLAAMAYVIAWTVLVSRHLGIGWGELGGYFVGLFAFAQAYLLLPNVLRPERSRSGSPGYIVMATALVLASVLVVTNGRAGEVTPAPEPEIMLGRPVTVVVLLVDTLRADRTTLGGYELQTTPALQALAGEHATYFSNATAAASSTQPSVKALFTSVPWSIWSSDLGTPLPASAWTMASAFGYAGYKTGAFSANGVVGRERAGAGFDHFETLGGHEFARRSYLLYDLLCGRDGLAWLRLIDRYRLHKESGPVIWSRARHWLSLAPRRASFLYVHFLEPHWPYYDHGFGFVGEELASITSKLSHVDLLSNKKKRREDDTFRDSLQMREIRARYDEEIRAADDAIAGVVDDLNRAGRLDSTLLVVVGDHGEEFLEHGGFSHGHDVYQEQVHVPLLIRWPRDPRFATMPARVDAPVSLMDLLPTFADYFSLGAPRYPLFGSSLRPLLEGRSHLRREPITAETREEEVWLGAYREGDWKVRVESRADKRGSIAVRTELFDLSADPGELTPLSPPDAIRQEMVRRAVDLFDRRWQRWRATAESGRGDGAEDAVRQLRALGYVR
jgi:arylsulfatase A-like enzyme